MNDFLMRKVDRPPQSAAHLEAIIKAKGEPWWMPSMRLKFALSDDGDDWIVMTDADQEGWSCDLAYSVGRVAFEVRQQNGWSGS